MQLFLYARRHMQGKDIAPHTQGICFMHGQHSLKMSHIQGSYVHKGPTQDPF